MLEIYNGIMNIMKIIEIHMRITKIMKILEILCRIIKIMQKLKNTSDNNENHKNYGNLYENQ